MMKTTTSWSIGLKIYISENVERLAFLTNPPLGGVTPLFNQLNLLLALISPHSDGHPNTTHYDQSPLHHLHASTTVFSLHSLHTTRQHH